MIESKILRNVCPAAWYSKAIAEYLEDCANSWQEFSNLLQIAFDRADEVYEGAITEEGLLDELWATSNLADDAQACINGAYVKCKDLLRQVIHVGSSELAQTATPFTNEEILFFNGTGEQIDSSNFTLTSVVDAMKDAYQSTVVNAAAFLATAHENISDKLSAFENSLKQRLADGASFLSSAVSQARSLLANTDNPSDFLEAFVSTTLPENVEDQDSPDLWLDTPTGEYTGTSPLICADFDGVAKVGATVVKAGVAVVGGILKGALAIGKKIFSWFGQKVNDTFIDPEVYEKIDGGDGYGCVDGFQYQYSGSWTQTFLHQDVFERLKEISARVDFDNWIVNKWYKMQTIFGEIMFRPAAAPNFEQVNTAKRVTVTGDIILKPYMVSFDTWTTVKAGFPELKEPGFSDLIDYRLANVDGSRITVDQVASFLATFAKMPSLYSLDPSSEGNASMVRNMQLGARGTAYAVMNGALELIATYLSMQPGDIQLDLGASSALLNWNANVDDGFKATNAHALAAACGYNPDAVEGRTYASFPAGYNSVTGGANFELIHTMFLLYMLLMIQRYDKQVNPFDYVFVPYSMNVQNISKADLRIRTDGDIQESVTNFITTAIVVTIVATLAIVGFTAVKKFQRQAYAKRMNLMNQLDQKSWNGEKWTASDARKYLRLKRKTECSSLLSWSNAGSSGDGVLSSVIDSLTPNKIDEVAETVTSVAGSVTNQSILIGDQAKHILF